MRSVNYTINKSVPTIQPVSVTNEEFVRIVEDKAEETIMCIVNAYSGIELVETKSIIINGDKYSLLMSGSPTFATGKPANEYREIDLWYVIDLIRSGQ